MTTPPSLVITYKARQELATVIEERAANDNPSHEQQMFDRCVTRELAGEDSILS